MYTLYITTSRTYKYLIVENNSNVGWIGNDLTKINIKDFRHGSDPWLEWIEYHGHIVQRYPLETLKDLPKVHPEFFI